MSSTRREPPRHVQALNRRIYNITSAAGQSQKLRTRRTVANVVVGQMLPSAVVEGGTSLKLRVGDALTRFTQDLDAAQGRDRDVFLDDFEEALSLGWYGFTGTLREGPPPHPVGITGDYVMQPFEVKLAYQGRSWLTVTFELGRDEIGSTVSPDEVMADGIVEMFRAVGLPDPDPIPVLALDHQIAQKLHACTTVSATNVNDRAHDLVDLQILSRQSGLDLTLVGVTCERLFASRRSQAWPPVVASSENWGTLYEEACSGLDVLDTLDVAVEWANGFVQRIVDASGRR